MKTTLHYLNSHLRPALAALVLGAGAAQAQEAPEDVSNVKHIILFIGDGMQLAHEVAASRYLTGEEAALSFHSLPYSTYCATWDVSTYNHYAAKLGQPAFDPATFQPWIGYDVRRGGAAPYPLIPDTSDSITYFLNLGGLGTLATDSASAGTAWATGYKTDDGNVAWLSKDPPDGALKTIAELMREQKGSAIGVVSTVPFTHATPAAHVSHNVSRNNYTQIADEIIYTVQPEVVIGGGNRNWGGNYLSAASQLALEQGQTAYTYVGRQVGQDGAAALLATAAMVDVNAGDKLFGLFGGKGGNFEYHTPVNAPGAPAFIRGSLENPLLKDCVEASLQVLSGDPDGFFVMFEQGDIDWANHANDFANMLGGVWDLDLAVRQAIDFVNRPGDEVDWDNTLLIVTADHGNSFMRVNDWSTLGQGYLPTLTKSTVPRQYDAGNVYYGTGGHTDELVMLYAMGSGRNLFKQYSGKAASKSWYGRNPILDNTQIFEVMRQAADLITSQPYK